MEAHRKTKKSALKITARQYSVTKAIIPISRLMAISGNSKLTAKEVPSQGYVVAGC
jgi:hypothetical protein